MSNIPTELLSALQIRRAAGWLAQGEVVVFPTETVYGIGANALQEEPCRRIYRAKRRPADNPLIVHVYSIAELLHCVQSPPRYLPPLLKYFTPGPLTVILPKAAHIPDVVTAQQPTVALRIPSHPIARRLLRRCGFPLAAPSANLSGQVSATSGEMAYQLLRGRVRAVLNGGASKVGLESTIVVPEAQQLTIVRQGAIEQADLQRRLPPHVTIVHQEHGNAAERITPGGHHPHYQPQATLHLFQYGDASALLHILQRRAKRANNNSTPPPLHANYALLLFRSTLKKLNTIVDARITFSLFNTNQQFALMPTPAALQRLGVRYWILLSNNQQYAHLLYHSLHECDRHGCSAIIAELPNPAERYNTALRDRLQRAAGEITT